MADAEQKPDTELVSIKVKSQDGQEVFFKLKKTAKLQKMMKAYAQRQAVDITAYQFLFDGKRIKESDTIEGLELEDGDEIDAMLHQTGGC